MIVHLIYINIYAIIISNRIKKKSKQYLIIKRIILTKEQD